MYELYFTTKSKKDLKKYKRDIEPISKVLRLIEKEGVKGVPVKMKPHKLKGNYKIIGTVT